MTLTPAQQDELRRINLAQIHGYKDLAQAMLAEFFTAYPALKTLYVRLHGGK